MNKNLFDFVYKTSTVLLLVLCVLMGLSAFEVLGEIKPKMFTVRLIHIFSFSAIILVGIYLITQHKISTKFYLIGLLAITFGIRLFYLFRNSPDQVSDFLYMYLQATELAAGQPNALKTDYYDFAIFNAPFTIYESYLLKWFDSILLLKVLSVIYSTFIVLYIYKIAKSIYGENVGRIAGFIACIFPPFIIYNVVLTNQTLSILFILIGIYNLIQKKYVKGGLFLAWGQIFRPIGIMFLIGGILMVLVEWWKKEKIFSKSRLKNLFLDFGKLILPYYAVLLLVSGGLLYFNFTAHGLFHDPAPSYKFLVGLNAKTQGGYSEPDNNLLKDIDEFERIAQEKIAERTISLNEVAKLFEVKFQRMWGERDASFFWAKSERTTPIYVNQILWILILFSAGSLLFYKQNTNDPLIDQKFYIQIVLLGFIMVYFLIEIQPRYRYEVYPLFILLASVGMNRFLNLSKKYVSKNKKKVFIIGVVTFILLIITLLPDSTFQRSIQKEIISNPNTQITEVEQKFSDNFQIKKLYIDEVEENTLLLRFELDDKIRKSDIYPYAISLRGGKTENPDDQELWDFKPVLYKWEGEKYLETRIVNPPDSLNYLSLALYDRAGFKGFKSAYIKIKLID